LLWEGLYYSLHHPTSSIISEIYKVHCLSLLTILFLSISRRARDKYHNFQDDDIMKNIFNSGRHKDKIVPLTQSQSIEGSTVLTPPAPVPNVDKADEMILQDTLQVSLAEHKSHEEQEARENVAMVDEHFASEEIEKMVDGQANVVDDSSIPRNDESNIPGIVIESRCYMSGHILSCSNRVQSQTSSVPDQQYQLYIAMKADPQLQQQDIVIWLALQMKFERNTLAEDIGVLKLCVWRVFVWLSFSKGYNSIITYSITRTYEEVSLTIDEAKLKKIADEMLRQRCTSGDEHQYHIDQMKNFLKSNIVGK
ncbi:hypothetical protein Tco_0581139, partial [Tanacetum coccineum]